MPAVGDYCTEREVTAVWSLVKKLSENCLITEYELFEHLNANLSEHSNAKMNKFCHP